MIQRSLRVRDDLVADTASYNMLMTTMLRAELGPQVWGNWTLDRALEPGMVGAVDPVAGTFERHKPGAIPLDVDVDEQVCPRKWVFQSPGVRHVPDVSSCEEAWTFPESHTIVSRGTHHVRRALRDPFRTVERHRDLIHRYADHRGYATPDGILQGFGVITATYEATDVLNLSSREAAATYVRGGCPDGVEAYAHADGGAGTAPYAFEFLSFSGRTLLPGWVGQVPAVTVSFHNSGSYVVQCTVAYDTSDAHDLRKRVQVGGGIPGWVYLPLDATNVRVSCRFWHVDDWGPRHVLGTVAHPMQEWPRGQGAVDIQGWWPGDYDVVWGA